MTRVRLQIPKGKKNDEKHSQNDEPRLSLRLTGVEGFGRNGLGGSKEDGRFEASGSCGEGADFGGGD